MKFIKLKFVEILNSYCGYRLATTLEEQIAVGGEKTSSGNHELEDEALVGLPLCGLMTFYTTRAIPLNYTEVMKCQSFLE